jgi:nucleotide-binding universal stress UspA family protein
MESEEIEDFYRILRERAEQCLAGWAEQLEQAGVEARQEIVVGKRAVKIARLAEELGCDPIILRSHRIDPESPLGGIGSISHQLAILANCSVMLMK